jgi:hypothetical protein
MRIRSSGNGEPGPNGGPPGDLYIEIRIKQHDIFERDGDDLHCTVPVPMTQAALGGSIEVPTLTGKVEIELPEGTQHGKTFRLRGKGIKGIRSSYPGDLYCHITLETPIKLTEHQRKLLSARMPSSSMRLCDAVAADLRRGLHAVVLGDYEFGRRLVLISCIARPVASLSSRKKRSVAMPRCVFYCSSNARSSRAKKPTRGLQCDGGAAQPSVAGTTEAARERRSRAIRRGDRGDPHALRIGDSYQVNYTYRLGFDVFGTPAALYRRSAGAAAGAVRRVDRVAG